MVESSHKTPWPRPSKRLQVDVADVIQHIIVMTRDSTNDEQFVVVEQCSMSGATFWYGSRDCWLCPVGSLEIKYNQVG